MVNVYSGNCLVYFNTMSKRGLIISTVSKAWTLFKHWQLPHKFKWVSDSWWQQNSIPLQMAGNDPNSVLALFSTLSIQPHIARPLECRLKWSYDFPMNMRASPGTRKGWVAGPGKVQNHRDLHHSTTSTTCKHSLRHTHKPHMHMPVLHTYTHSWDKSNMTCEPSPISAVWSSLEWSVRGQMLPCFLYNGTFYCVTVFDSFGLWWGQ